MHSEPLDSDREVKHNLSPGLDPGTHDRAEHFRDSPRCLRTNELLSVFHLKSDRNPVLALPLIIN